MNPIYVLLRASNPQRGEIKTVLVSKEEFKECPEIPDYFLSGFEDFKNLGEFEISGNDKIGDRNIEQLGSRYTED